MKHLKKVGIVLVFLASYSLSAMEKQQVLSASAITSRIFVASQLGNTEKVLAELETAYQEANVRLVSRTPAKKEGMLVWKVDLSNGGIEYTDDAAIWVSLLRSLNQVHIDSAGTLKEKALLLTVLASKSLAIESAQRLLFAEDPAVMAQGWQQYFKLKEPITDEVKALVSDQERLKVLNETVEQQTKRAIAWRKGFLENLSEECSK